jgi:hypothetical protein
MKYKNNKEHPIDNLFAQKLSNLEGSPSDNAWQTLEKGLSQKPRKKNKAILWFPYAAAAAIALLVVSVWLLSQQTSSTRNTTGLATIEQGKVGQKQNITATTSDTPAAKDQPNLLPKNEATQVQIAMQEKVDKIENQKEAVVKNKQGDSRKITTRPAERNIPEKNIPTQPVVKEVEQTRGLNPAITSLENTVTQLEKDKQPSVVTPSSLTEQESTTIVVTVNLEEKLEEPEEMLIEETGEVQKKSRAGKFFSTLKKIKKGDFNELGIRPETIVAYVKDKASNNQSNEKQ